ncbi:Asp-tRNA(Asn)/Glu-tRNA(Gln) amidotransferase A subunit family amidase [Paraburkholderia sp. BL18I3N2]|uniref:amidase n=1 Tax=Paraburkholderia sp. BL18I3N2 TaxID=1938799 RepID=UPI000D07815E|nr:amidase [Paraburkholderia sp. BL18I3N2]PRX33357.1 Asp-tRNA(Asn)/Glu-tRNA(Gln) amidotransferase A subunit family amidase [Paraburkholderia sp. BL18I3N2]
MTSSNEELVTKSAEELRRLIGTKQISPVELVDACIDRIESLNPAVNAVTATRFDSARSEAKVSEQQVMDGRELGLLHGLPMGVKDLEDTAGLLTTYGSPMSRGNVPSRDVVLVERLRQQGAILLAKTNVPELGAGANTRNPVWGATGNPFNPALNAGGSSGGSAAALACDMLPVCTGSDTGGSLRIPASKCGVVGFRPSPGLVPNSRRLLGWTPISVVGPMGRTVAEAALQLAATAGESAGDPLSYSVDALSLSRLGSVDLSKLRVGYTEDFGCCDVDQTIRETFRSRVAAIKELVHTCEPVDFKLGEVHRCFDVIRAESFVAGLHAAYERDRNALGPNTRANYEMGAKMSLADSAWAQSEQTRIFQRFQSAFSRYDILISPTTPVSPFPWTELYASTVQGRPQENYYRWLALTYVVTLTTHPALSLPCGVDEAGMPFGLQIVGPFRGDSQTLAVSHAFERAFAVSPTLRRPRPNVSHLRAVNPALKSLVTSPPIFTASGSGTSGLSMV